MAHFYLDGTMWRFVAMYLCVVAGAGLGRVRADENADELALLAGEYTAESSVRTGQEPALKSVLEALTLEVNKDAWTQKFRGETALYTISLDLTRNPKAMELTSQKVRALRNCTYVLKEGLLTVYEQRGEIGDVVVTVWKRKPNPAK